MIESTNSIAHPGAKMVKLDHTVLPFERRRKQSTVLIHTSSSGDFSSVYLPSASHGIMVCSGRLVVVIAFMTPPQRSPGRTRLKFSVAIGT